MENIPVLLCLSKVISGKYSVCLTTECEIIVNQAGALYKNQTISILNLYIIKSVFYGEYQQICIAYGNVSVDLFRLYSLHSTFFR